MNGSTAWNAGNPRAGRRGKRKTPPDKGGAEFLGDQLDMKKILQAPDHGNTNPLPLRREVMAKLRQEIDRLRHSNSPQVLHFVDTMICRYPELRP